MSKVSIIIPAFNQGRFLAAAIESALGQTHPEVEVVVIDDGSTDETSEVAARFAGRIKYVRQANTGLPGARNRGIAESSGDYLCFLDSDDLLHPEKVARQAAILDADPEAGFAYCDIVTVDEAGAPLKEQPSVNSPGRVMSGNIFPTLMMAGYFPPHTVLIRRRVLEAVGGFDPALGGHADYELWLRVSAAGHRAVFVDEKLASYRTYSASMSKDGQHMGETRLAAFGKLARAHPELVAAAVHQLQQSNQDLFQANEWLQTNWQDVLKNVGSMEPGCAGGDQRFSFLKNIARARLSRGREEQKAVWDVTLDGVQSKALLLQPPAELAIEVPTGARGRLTTAGALHPDVWNNPQAGGCELGVRVDGRVALVLAIDPVRLPADRCWHPIVLEVPENAAGRHQVVFETKGIGGNDFRWALWRSPSFTWQSAAATPAREISPAIPILKSP